MDPTNQPDKTQKRLYHENMDSVSDVLLKTNRGSIPFSSI